MVSSLLEAAATFVRRVAVFSDFNAIASEASTALGPNKCKLFEKIDGFRPTGPEAIGMAVVLLPV